MSRIGFSSSTIRICLPVMTGPVAVYAIAGALHAPIMTVP